MKISFWAALGCLIALAGCQQATSSSTSNSTKSLTVTSTSTSVYQYYDLSTGAEVADPATQSWDIAFNSTTGGVRTNSGATASAPPASATVATPSSSGGLGGVYYAGSSDFDSVTTVNSSGFGDVAATDASVYTSTTMDGVNYTTSQIVVNKITKLDYDGGDGTSDTPYTYTDLATAYGGDAYYSYNDTTHAISASGEVYVVRHGDGTHYSKFQVTSLTGSNSSRVRVIKYSNF